MIKAYKLYTGEDGNSHVMRGVVMEHAPTDVVRAHFQETPPHGRYDWHTAPEEQYVITLSGTLEFTTRGGESFVLRPGDVLIAKDTTGTAHSWRLIDDQPWRRLYVVFKSGAPDLFVPEDPQTPSS